MFQFANFLWQLKCAQSVMEMEQSRLCKDVSYSDFSWSKWKEVVEGNQVKKAVLLSPTVCIKILVYLKK